MTRTDLMTFSSNEIKIREEIVEMFRQCPIPDHEILENLPLFIKRRDLMRILFINQLYMKILNTPGVIMEFGVRWGKNMALYESFRGMYEPYNHVRKIIGFDTFQGFPTVDPKDGKSPAVHVGQYSVTQGYEKYLEAILDYHEKESPISHIKKYELIKGDATVQLEKYLKDHPETIIALAYFDFDIYAPTKRCLELIKPHLVKGSVIGFDELAVQGFPGETVALSEVFGLNNVRVVRNEYSSVQTYMVIE
jgi:hypothetical protein